MKTTSDIQLSTADFSRPDGLEDFENFWTQYITTNKFSVMLPMIVRQKLNSQKFLDLDQQKTEAEIRRELVLAEFYRLHPVYRPQIIPTKPKKVPQERKLYETEVNSIRQELNSIVTFARLGGEDSMLNEQERIEAYAIYQNLLAHYSTDTSNLDDPLVVKKIYDEIVSHIVDKIVQGYIDTGDTRTRQELANLVRIDPKYRNDEQIDELTKPYIDEARRLEILSADANQDFLAGRITGEEFSIVCNNQANYLNRIKEIENIDSYDKNKAALRALTQIAGQRSYHHEATVGDERFMAFENYNHHRGTYTGAGIILKKYGINEYVPIKIVQYMCLQWLAACDLNMPVSEENVISAKPQLIAKITSDFINGSIDEAEKQLQLAELENKSIEELTQMLMPTFVADSKTSFITVLGDICREHSISRGKIPWAADYSSCIMGVYGRLARVNKYNTIATMKEPGTLLKSKILHFILQKRNSLPEEQQINIGKAIDEILTSTGSLFGDENMPLAKSQQEAIEHFLNLLTGKQAEEEFQKLIEPNLRELITNNLVIPVDTIWPVEIKKETTNKVIKLSYQLAVRNLKLDSGKISKDLVTKSVVAQLADQARVIVTSQGIYKKFIAAKTPVEQQQLEAQLDTSLKAIKLHGLVMRDKIYIKELKSWILEASTPNYGIVPFSKMVYKGLTYNRIKIPTDGNCLISSVLNGCSQAGVVLPGDIKSSRDLRNYLVVKMTELYNSKSTELLVLLYTHGHNPAEGWQNNQNYFTFMDPDSFDIDKNKFIELRDTITKFHSAINDHNVHYVDHTIDTIEGYLARMAQDNIWCGGIELQFLSDFLKTKIITHSNFNDQAINFGENLDAVPEFHIYHTGNHYELLWNKDIYDFNKVLPKPAFQCIVLPRSAELKVNLTSLNSIKITKVDSSTRLGSMFILPGYNLSNLNENSSLESRFPSSPRVGNNTGPPKRRKL